jgi:CubicO group peptidase (beta-lactamase class C family)
MTPSTSKSEATGPGSVICSVPSRDVSRCSNYKMFKAVWISCVLLVSGCSVEPSSDHVALSRLIESHVRKDSPGLAVAVLDDGRVAFESTRGLANLDSKTSIDSDTQFYLASVSKQFTAMAVAILEARGLLRYDETLADIFSDLPPHLRGVTLDQLLRHTSGLGDYLADRSPPETNEEVLQSVRRSRKLLFPPGTKFRYSNTGYNLLATCVQTVSKQPFPDFMNKEIFAPLDMTNTLVCTLLGALDSSRAVGFRAKGAAFVSNDYALRTFGDGGIFSTLNDMKKWCRALEAHVLLKPEKQDQLFSYQALSSGEDSDYGRTWHYGGGWFVEDTAFGKCIHHSGGLAGFRTRVEWHPDLKIWVILLANRNDLGLDDLSRNVFEAYHPAASTEQTGSANRSQPVGHHTNQTSVSAGSGG